MNQVSLALVALATGALLTGVIITWLRNRRSGTAFGAVSSCSPDTLHALFEQSPDSILVTDRAGLRVLDANVALQRALGYSHEELLEMTLIQLLAHEGEALGGILKQLRHPSPRMALQVRQRCKDGGVRDAEISGHPIELPQGPAIVFTAHDVSVRRKAEAQLLEKQQHLDHLAHHDQLTGLPNRLYLAAHLPEAIEEARCRATQLAVLFLDLDRFKHINDSRGHETGDKLLKAVAQRVRATVRADDVVVRMGGDEFIVILKHARNAEEVHDTALRINEALAAPVMVDSRPLVTTVSIGVSLYPRDGADMGELLRHSDTAMYQAKDRGRNNFQLFSPAMERKSKDRMLIETDLRNAMKTAQLDVHYQPIIDIHNNKVVALESLLRWRHPSRGVIPPERFIGVAEETGLIVPIGEFVLNRAMVDMCRWRQAGCNPVPIAVNVSAVQLQRSDLPATIARLTKEYQVKPNMLQLELTESSVFERRESRTGESNVDAVARLRELGVRIAIDDFGTGYSSLSYLKQWRVDYLKIDRSFVRDLVTDPSDLAIVSAIIAMAKHLHIKVIAEGIEGWQQLEKLRQMGCNLAQGFLFAKPAPESQCARYLSGEPLNLVEQDIDSSTTNEHPKLEASVG